MRYPVTRAVLAGSGAMLGLIGAAMLTNTQAFLGTSGVEIGSDPGLLSELKAPSGLLILVAGLMLVGSVRSHLAKVGLVAGAAVYGSYGAARIVGFLIDGLPSESLIAATAIEVLIAAVLLALLSRHRGSAHARRAT